MPATHIPSAPENALHDLMLRYIRLHPEGVTLAELQSVYNESRVFLGYIINRMIEDGKVTRSFTRIYPAASL